MDQKTMLGVFAILLALGSGLVVVLYFLRSRNSPDLRGMMSSGGPFDGNSAEDQPDILTRAGVTTDGDDLIKQKLGQKTQAKSKNYTLSERLFHAGMFNAEDRLEFTRLRVIVPFITVPLIGAGLWIPAGPQLGMIGIVLGALVGYQIPFSYLDRRIDRRHEDIMFYLPLVIEQISIGVSSSLDIGPCIQRVVSMADERDSHNVVTELMRFAQNYIKSGVPFEDAMVETGKASGQTELKHAFMYLAQVAKHGGEITRQLQELADSVSAQRQAYIEGRIKKLELHATGPVSLVFLGFLVILLIGFGVQLKTAF